MSNPETVESPESNDRRELLRTAILLGAAAASAGFAPELLALAQEKKDSMLGGLAKSVTGDKKITDAVVNVLADALVTKDVAASTKKVAGNVTFPEKEKSFLGSLSGSDLGGVSNFYKGLKGLDAGTATGVLTGLLGKIV